MSCSAQWIRSIPRRRAHRASFPARQSEGSGRFRSGTGIGVTTVYPAWVDTPMVHQETVEGRLHNVQILLTPQQVAAEVLQAVTEGKRDLTLAPNPDIAFALQLFTADQDKAEDVMGQAIQRQLANLAQQSS